MEIWRTTTGKEYMKVWYKVHYYNKSSSGCSRLFSFTDIFITINLVTFEIWKMSDIFCS